MEFDEYVAKSLGVKVPEEYSRFMKRYAKKLAADPINQESWISGLGDSYFVVGTTLAFRDWIPHFLQENMVIGYLGTKTVIIDKTNESIDNYLILNTKDGNIFSMDFLGVQEIMADSFEDWVRPELLRAKLKEKYQRTFTVVLFDDELKAEEARLKLMHLRREGYIDLEDAVVAVKEERGQTRFHHMNKMPIKGGAVGSVTGLIVGALLLHPLLGAAFGAVTGAVSAELGDAGIENHFIEDLAANFKPGSSALFALVHKSQPDKVLEGFRGFGGKILVSSMSKEKTARLQACLDVAQGADRQGKAPDCPKWVMQSLCACEAKNPSGESFPSSAG